MRNQALSAIGSSASIGSRSAYVGGSGAMLGCSAVIGGIALLGSTAALGSSAVRAAVYPPALNSAFADVIERACFGQGECAVRRVQTCAFAMLAVRREGQRNRRRSVHTLAPSPQEIPPRFSPWLGVVCACP